MNISADSGLELDTLTYDGSSTVTLTAVPGVEDFGVELGTATIGNTHNAAGTLTINGQLYLPGLLTYNGIGDVVFSSNVLYPSNNAVEVDTGINMGPTSGNLTMDVVATIDFNAAPLNYLGVGDISLTSHHSTIVFNPGSPVTVGSTCRQYDDDCWR